MAYNRFKKGSGVYTCSCCKQQTRDTSGDAVHCGLCSECYEVAGWVNSVSDGVEGAEERLKAAVKHAVERRGCKNCAEEVA